MRKLLFFCWDSAPSYLISCNFYFQKEYQTQLQLLFKGSSITQSLVCIGKGLEKRIEIIGESLEFGPVLPNSEDDIKNLIIRNPTCHPIELFCLEMDEIYLQEEKVCPSLAHI